MIVTGALLAQSADVVDNKLDIKGGVVDSFHAGADRRAWVTLVVLIKPELLDLGPTIDVTITAPQGDTKDLNLEVPRSSLGGEVGFVLYPLVVPVPVNGRYVLTVSALGGGSVTLPLKVSG